MEIRKLDDGSIELFGYANITERKSKILSENGMKFREEIKKGAWNNAINRNKDIKLLLNHSWDKVYGSTMNDLTLFEDNIGARFSIRTKDETLIKYAEDGDYKGLSFAFRCLDDDFSMDGAIKLRTVNDMEVFEISLLTVEPAYDGSLVEMRDSDGNKLEKRDYRIDLEVDNTEETRQQEQQKELELRIRLMEIELEI